METRCVVPSLVGPLELVERQNSLAGLYFAPSSAFSPPCTPLLENAARQLEEYFAGRRRQFALPLAPQGTAFQQKVWAALCAIPYGETRSYLQIAQAVGDARACRAVGMANHRNPISIVVPCHRVVGANGSLTGYGGGLEIKQTLLELERRFS